MERIKTLKRTCAIIFTCIIIGVWINPFHVHYRKVRFDCIKAFCHAIIAPFGNVQFKTYLMAEILTDCFTQFDDVGRIVGHFVQDNWLIRLDKLSRGETVQYSGIKWILYIVSFLPYTWRMN